LDDRKGCSQEHLSLVRIHRGTGGRRVPPISGRWDSHAKVPHLLTHIDAIAGFTSQSLGLPAYACKTDSLTAIKLAPKMRQNAILSSKSKKMLGRGYSPILRPLPGVEVSPLPTPHSLRLLRRLVPRVRHDSSPLFKPWIDTPLLSLFRHPCLRTVFTATLLTLVNTARVHGWCRHGH